MAGSLEYQFSKLGKIIPLMFQLTTGCLIAWKRLTDENNVRLHMKNLLFLLLCFGLFHPLRGSEDTPYQTTLRKIEDRHMALEAERFHPGNTAKILSPADEKELQQLTGQLMELHPLWVLFNQLAADIRVLAVQKPLDAKDAALLEDLKEFLAFSAVMQGRAKNLEEAQEQTDVLRRFIVRRDFQGLKKWTATFR